MPNNRKKSADRSYPGKRRVCSSCDAAILPEARFCHACGTSLQGGPGGGKWSADRLAGVGSFVAVIAAIMFAVLTSSKRAKTPPPSTPAAPIFSAPSAPSEGSPPDLAQMTPREAADILFNRVMTANKQGNRAEALRFVPMAVQAYGNLAELDRDAHFHLSLIHAVAGDCANADREIVAMKLGAPNHLLSMSLEHDTAQQAGDLAAASLALAAFAAAHDAEIATGLPENETHDNVIERLRTTAQSRAVSSAALPAGAARNGADLFAGNCAACHGRGATVNDKGPPLVHKIYEPSYHDDGSFYRAVRQGVPAHHWSFGNMAPVPGIADDEVGQIVVYVRKLQRAAGIDGRGR